MLIRIPPFRERFEGQKPPKFIFAGVKHNVGYYDGYDTNDSDLSDSSPDEEMEDDDEDSEKDVEDDAEDDDMAEGQV